MLNAATHLKTSHVISVLQHSMVDYMVWYSMVYPDSRVRRLKSESYALQVQGDSGGGNSSLPGPPFPEDENSVAAPVS